MTEEEKEETSAAGQQQETTAPQEEETSAAPQEEETGAGKTEAAAAGEAQEKKPGQMTEEELREEIEKQFCKQKVDEVLVQFMITLSNLAYIKMGLTEETADVRDLAQASLAIDTFKVLLDAAGGRLPDQDAKALAGALSSMQMTFVRESSEGS